MKFLSTLLFPVLLAFALAGGAKAGETVNINTADVATLDRVLLNVGPVKAQAIIDYRKANGAFRSAEQLAMVKGIGLKTVESNRERIIISAPRTAVLPASHAANTAPAQQVARR